MKCIKFYQVSGTSHSIFLAVTCTDLLDPGVSLSWQEELANFCIAGVILWMLNVDNERRLMMKGHMYYSMCCF